MPESENLNELRSKYQDAVVGEIGRLATNVRELTQKVDEVKYSLAQTNLTELKNDVRTMKEQLTQANLVELKADVKLMKDDLTRHNLKELNERVDKHDKQITRAVAVLVFLQIAIGLFAALARFILS